MLFKESKTDVNKNFNDCLRKLCIQLTHRMFLLSMLSSDHETLTLFVGPTDELDGPRRKQVLPK